MRVVGNGKGVGEGGRVCMGCGEGMSNRGSREGWRRADLVFIDSIGNCFCI